MLTYWVLSLWIATASGPTPVDLSTHASQALCATAAAQAMKDTARVLDAQCVQVTHTYRPR